VANLDVYGSMDVKREWLRRVLGITLDDVGTEPPRLGARLNEIGLRMRDLGQAPEAEQIKQRFAEAVQALKGGARQQAATILDDIEPRLAGALSAARGQEARRVIANAKVWRDAVASITGAIAGLKAAVMSALQAEGEHDPEELDDIEQALDADLDAITDRLSAGLADQVDAVVSGDAAQRKAAVPKIKARIDEIETWLAGDAAVSIIEDNGLQPTSIAAPAKAALGKLRLVLDNSVA
jgi:hypothetical protein